MSGITELIRTETDGTISFGNHTLTEKTKLSDFKHDGDIYKVKTFNEITRLEKNDKLIYESVPGTTVYNFDYSGESVRFMLEGSGDTQLTLGLKEETIYRITVDDENIGSMKTTMSGKLSISLEIDGSVPVKVEVKEIG